MNTLFDDITATLITAVFAIACASGMVAMLATCRRDGDLMRPADDRAAPTGGRPTPSAHAAPRLDRPHRLDDARRRARRAPPT